MNIKKIIIVVLFCISSFFTTLEDRNNELNDSWYPDINSDAIMVILEADPRKNDNDVFESI